MQTEIKCRKKIQFKIHNDCIRASFLCLNSFITDKHKMFEMSITKFIHEKKAEFVQKKWDLRLISICELHWHFVLHNISSLSFFTFDLYLFVLCWVNSAFALRVGLHQRTVVQRQLAPQNKSIWLLFTQSPARLHTNRHINEWLTITFEDSTGVINRESKQTDRFVKSACYKLRTNDNKDNMIRFCGLSFRLSHRKGFKSKPQLISMHQMIDSE